MKTLQISKYKESLMYCPMFTLVTPINWSWKNVTADHKWQFVDEDNGEQLWQVRRTEASPWLAKTLPAHNSTWGKEEESKKERKTTLQNCLIIAIIFKLIYKMSKESD